jgi:uncharacterized glyoxalase superfamily protein PhnB
MTFTPPIPILRSFDEALAKRFYCDYLGFKVDWEHRFEPSTPLYMQVSRDDCVLHLSEHHGDASPGAAVRIGHPDVRAFHKELLAKPGYGNNPGLQDQDWGMREVTVTDPFSNRLVFCTDL